MKSYFAIRDSEKKGEMSSIKDKRKQSGRKLSRCNVRGCSRQINIPIHSLPSSSSEKMRRVWMNRLKITLPLKASQFYVCGNHFEPDDYNEVKPTPNSRRKLKRNAIPSLNLPSSSDESMSDHKSDIDGFSYDNELAVEINHSCKREPLSECKMLHENMDVEVDHFYKIEPLPEENCDEFKINDELILGL